MAEMVLRRHRGRKERMLDAKRQLVLPSSAQVKQMLAGCMEAAPGFLLAMADVLSIPSGMHAAYAAALAGLDRPMGKTLAGAAAAMLLRILCGLAPRWEGLITLLILLAGPMVVHGRGNGVMMGFTAVAMLPYAIAGLFGSTAMAIVTGCASVLLSALSAPLMYRGLLALHGRGRNTQQHPIDSMEERLCVGYLGAMLLCGGARLLLGGVNAGMLMATAAVMMMAMHLGAGAGCAAGMISGAALALQGLPMMHAVALAMGGFLAGVVHALGRRWATCLAFLLSAGLAMGLCGTMGLGCGLAVGVSCAMVAFMPRSLFERSQRFFRRFLASHPVPGDAYAACMLASWEKTVEAMAMAVPSPKGMEETQDGAWWEEKLCCGCPDAKQCGAMRSDLAVAKAETVWDCREADDAIWSMALEELRGLGCQRLYLLMESMNHLRAEDALRRRSIRRATHQRDMLVTHLSAMAGAARSLMHLSCGESWWEDMTARRIRRVLADSALPVRLSWVRRVQGHVQAAFVLDFITGARRQAEELCSVVSAIAGVPMETARVDGDQVLLTETPLLQVEFGSCSEAIGGEGCVCGDTAWCGRLQDGRCMLAVSDGMGHGERAALASRQTVELLRLCLEAGYTRAQTLTAVNGMMLLSGHGERFTTVDLLTVDLWSGSASLDKLGAAGSWLYQQGTLRQLTGDALPLGILENIESRECRLRLQDGDALILLTDGVEEAFGSAQALEDAIWLSLEEATCQEAANAILCAAGEYGLPRADDQTVAVIRIARTAVQNASNAV